MSTDMGSYRHDTMVETAAARRAIALVDHLIEVIEAENRDLAGGLPVASGWTAADKSGLADDLRRLMATEFGREAVARTAPEVRDRLRERAIVLERVTHENMIRLQAAITATRRRVDAVMKAIREQVAREHRGYGADGRMPQRRAGASAGMGYLA